MAVTATSPCLSAPFLVASAMVAMQEGKYADEQEVAAAPAIRTAVAANTFLWAGAIGHAPAHQQIGAATPTSSVMLVPAFATPAVITQRSHMEVDDAPDGDGLVLSAVCCLLRRS